MESKKKIRINDRFRALLTETLPYEKLFTISNFSFHSIIKHHLQSLPWAIDKILKVKGYTIPFDYEIFCKPGKTRKLSLVHPAKQIEVADFYEKYRDYILFLCGKSDFSLRRPASNFKYYYVSERKDNAESAPASENTVNSEVDPFELEDFTYRSYFVYKPYSFIFDFYNSWKFLDLENRFSRLAVLDISKCFYRIYTHTIAWSVKSRQFAKQHASKKTNSFEAHFDSLMMDCNFGETNGIVVGPEFSRIFAEIIFQRVDAEINKSLKRNYNLIENRDFTICRYVDDFFIFYSNEEVLVDIIKVLNTELDVVKLGLNESKSDKFVRPFLPKETSAKLEISRIVDGFFLDFLKEEGGNFPARLEDRGKKFVQEIKRVVEVHNVEYSRISRYTMQSISSRATQWSNYDGKNLSPEITLPVIIRILFLLYSYDCNYRTTNIICLCFLNIRKFLNKKKPSSIENIDRVFFEKATSHIGNRVNETKRFGVDEMNILIVLSEIWDSHPLSVDKVKTWIGKAERLENVSINYFTTLAFLHYFADRKVYFDAQKEIVNLISFQMKNYYDVRSAHDTLLILDLMSCPWVEEKQKRAWARIVCLKLDPDLGLQKVEQHSKSMVKFCSSRTWFMAWNVQGRLIQYLEKSEKRRTPYA